MCTDIEKCKAVAIGFTSIAGSCLAGLNEISSIDESYAAESTMTLGELQSAITSAIENHGLDYKVRVDTTYDQGQRFMAITAVESKREGYVAIVA